MNYCAVWSLKRGVIDPPEILDEDCMLDVERGYLASLERDPPVTMEQMWFEQGAMMGFYNSRNRQYVVKKVAERVRARAA